MLVFVALSMLIILGAAALAIDLGSFFQAQRQAQTAADAGALAAAQDLPNTTTAMSGDATTFATTNDPGVSVTVTQPTSTTVKVTVNRSTPSFFGQVLGLTSANVGASAVAGETGFLPCSAAGSNCFALFAKDSTCANNGINLGGGVTITGGVHSNGSINLNGGGSSLGPTTFSNATGCAVLPSGYAGQGNRFTSGPTAEPPISIWPIDYTKDFQTCTGAACSGACSVTQTPCPPTDKTPGACTSASASTKETLQTYTPATLVSGNIYCDVGSGQANNPSSYNGAITVAGGPVEASFVAGSVTINGGSTVTACGSTSSGYLASACNTAVPAPATTNYPLIYATGTGTAINDSAGGNSFSGDLFAPAGTIDIGGGSWTTFAEGLDITAPGGGFTGDGPQDTGSSSTGTTSESLLQ